MPLQLLLLSCIGSLAGSDQRSGTDLSRRALRRRTSFREREKHAPVVGDAAPDFELPYLGETAKTVRLSDVLRKRPVALVFGSYT